MTTRTPNLRGLIALAKRDGVDIRPTLLRVITDLFVQEAVHSPAEVERYVELARHMIEAVDEASRAAVAMKLARYANAPRELLMLLARDTAAVAEHVLRRAHFSEADLLHLLDTLEEEHREFIAGRNDLPAAVAARLAAPAEPAAIARTAPKALPWSASPPTAAPEAPAGADGNLAALPLANEKDFAFAVHDLEQAALGRRPDQFIDRLARVFDLSRQKAEEVVRDPSGKAVAAACRALDMPCETFSRIIMLLDPSIGHSVELVFSLAEHYSRLPVAQARVLVASWRQAEPAAARHLAATAPDGAGRHGFEPRRIAPAQPGGARAAARG